MNNIVLVGRVVDDLECKELENGKLVSNLTVAVTRNYKNTDGIYETDFIRCELWNTIASNCFEYLTKGDVIGIKGRLENKHFEVDGETKHTTKVVAEKVTFLSNNKNEKTDEEEKGM